MYDCIGMSLFCFFSYLYFLCGNSFSLAYYIYCSYAQYFAPSYDILLKVQLYSYLLNHDIIHIITYLTIQISLTAIARLIANANYCEQDLMYRLFYQSILIFLNPSDCIHQTITGDGLPWPVLYHAILLYFVLIMVTVAS